MISIQHLCKKYRTRHSTHTVLDNINFDIHKGEKIGILGRNGSGKSTLIRLIGGVEAPTSGLIKREMKVSWPLAFSGAFQGSLTGLDNLHFIARIYNVDSKQMLAFTKDFSELGEYLYEPVKSYSSGMRARLAFALSLSVEFDCYLIDEITAVGDSRFKERCHFELFEKRKDRSLLMVSHNLSAIKQYCDKAYVLKSGVLYTDFATIDAAHQFYIDNGG